MTKLGGVYFECLAMFFDRTNLELRTDLMEAYQKALACLYNSPVIGMWICENFKYLSRKVVL
jgi:hypothetical protein